VLITDAQRNAYAEKWSDGFFHQRAQLAHRYNRRVRGLATRAGGSKKKKIVDGDDASPN
jgi:hypothetical protein